MPAIDTTPYWKDSAPISRYPQLDRDLTVDVVVIGAGMTGITAAYLLKRAGLTVAIVERARCVEIDTCHTTAHLTCVTDTRLSSLVESFGEHHAQAVWDAGLAAIAQIDECIRTENIECDFGWVPGYLHAPVLDEVDTHDVELLKREAEVAASLGFDARFRERVPFVSRPGVELDGQARFHPRKYLAALAGAVDGNGCFIFEHTNADDVSDAPLGVVAGDHRLTCDHVVVATHNPIVGKAGMLGAALLQTKLALYTSYVVGGRVAPDAVPDALFWDTADPYRYLRVERHRGHDYVIFGGEDHKTGQEADTRQCFERLEAAAARMVPGLEITHRWSGQVIDTNDGLPFIGEMAPRQFVATGFSGNGMTFGTLAAMMARDAVTGRSNPWAELFDVGRTKIRGGLWNYLKENKDYPYYLIRDRFAGAEGRTLRALARGAGKILDLDGKRVAAFRDVDGTVTLRSPICTHLGCQVQWNPAERTWDCPCHGSRFWPSGKVLSGPAESPLDEVTESTR